MHQLVVAGLVSGGVAAVVAAPVGYFAGRAGASAVIEDGQKAGVLPTVKPVMAVAAPVAAQAAQPAAVTR